MHAIYILTSSFLLAVTPGDNWGAESAPTLAPPAVQPTIPQIPGQNASDPEPVMSPRAAAALIDDVDNCFQPEQTTRSCECVGYPGIDWYRGRERIAVTSVQHYRAIRWKDFPTDAVLTPESAAWLK